jgi:C-terminal processing protease CtpA/Prc
MGLDRHGNAGRHTITVSSIVKDNSVFRDNRIRVGDRITHIDGQACEVGSRCAGQIGRTRRGDIEGRCYIAVQGC